MLYKLVVFDVDGTLTQEKAWASLHDHVGLDQDYNLNRLQKYLDKELGYDELVKEQTQLWKEKGATKAHLMEGIKHFTLIDGALETIQELKKKGYKLAIISGTLNLVLEQIFPEYKKYFDYAFFNHVLFDDEGNIIGHETTPYDHEHKATGLKFIAEKEGLDVSECIFIGDNNNDVEIAKAAGLSIAFNCKSEALAEVASVIVMSHDMRNILDYIP